MKKRKSRKSRKSGITDVVQFKGLAGKIVECADSFVSDGQVHFDVRFSDRTELVLAVGSPQIVHAELVRFSRDGNMKVVRSYKKSR